MTREHRNATTVTLIMPPIGALLFGMWADKRGRKIPLMADVVFYSIVGFLRAFVPNYTVLLVLRLLYGIGMGGEWGLGASPAMEKIPPRRRGLVTGLLQQGYAIGYLLAAVAYLLITNYTSWGWRGLFAFSLVPAVVILSVRTRVGESELWQETHEQAKLTQTRVRDVLFNGAVLRRFGYLIVLMTLFNWLSHGSQDVYPTFLKSPHGLHFSADTALYVAMLYNVGALLGGLVMGAASERFGRRVIIVFCCVLGLPVLPLFAASHTLGLVCLGSFLMQFVVQGAWAVVPANLSEQSPPEVRGFYPGVTYQLGNCLAAFNLPIQERLAAAHSYTYALVATMVPVLVLLAVVSALGKEDRGRPLATSSRSSELGAT